MSYQEFAKSMKLNYSKSAGMDATFVPNKVLPIYNWFYYKEGFSRDLVFSLIEKFSISPQNLVLDPFCGSGTTLLACKQKDISSIGLDVLPISVFASRVKTADYDAEELKEAAKHLLKTKFYQIFYDYPGFMKNAFSKYALEDISVFRKAIMQIESKKLRDFFMLALINSAMKCSYAWKDGGVIKFKKKPAPPLRIMLRRVIYNMIRDIEHFEKTAAASLVEQGDARKMKFANNSVDAVITSPPYLNNIDYTKVYEIEQFIIHEHEEPAVRSYIGFAKDLQNDILPELDLPPAAIAYFTDMETVLKEMHRVLKSGGNAALVVGNAYFSGIEKIIDSDLILAYLAKRIGFEVQDVVVLNERFALENRTQKKGVLRESMIILKKE
jgi:DNA modification methylase